MTDATARPAPDTVPEVIRAQSFEVVDRDGNTRAQFGLVPEEDGSDDLTQVVFFGVDGRPRAGITCDPEGAAIVLFDNNGGGRMMMATGLTDGSVVFELMDGEDKAQFSVIVDAGGAVLMDGWSGWANEQLRKNEAVGDALKALAARVNGFMDEDDDGVTGEEDDVIRRLCAGMRRRGRADRAALLEAAARP